MIRTLTQRCFLVLSMVAMLGIVAVVPIGSIFASGKRSMAMADHAVADMPCHKTIKTKKRCPDCPQKTCPDGAACMIKCFQQLSAVLAKSLVFSKPLATAGIIRPDVSPASGFPPPPLRPPIV